MANFLRAREIKGVLNERGYEKGVVWCLEVLAEQQIALQKDMRDLANLVDQMANITQSLVGVGEQMKSTIEKLNSEALYEDGMGKNTQDLS